MPNYILNRNHTHRSLFGVVSFVKGEPSWVIPALEKEIIAIGGERADGTVVDPLDPETVEKAPLSPQEREDELYAAFGLLIERNDSKDFTGAGTPKVASIEKIVEFNTDRSEIEGYWAAYKIAKAEDEAAA